MNYFEQESERLIYKKLENSDIAKWESFFIGNNRLHFLAIDTSQTPHQLAKEWIEKQQNRYKTDGLGHLAVIEKESGEMVGVGGILTRFFDNKPYFEVSYSLKPVFWGKGFGTEIAQQMKKFGQENGIASHFISIIHKENRDSIRVAEKNGMIPLFDSSYLGMDVIVYGDEKR